MRSAGDDRVLARYGSGVSVPSDLHVVLGASGGTGGALVGELLRRGHRVRAVSRRPGATRPGGVARMSADVATIEGAVAACAGAAVVYYAAQPAYTRWVEEFPALTDAIVAGASTAGAKLVFADNLYMYGPADGPMSEETPMHATSRKGRVRILMAERLLEASRSNQLRVTIGRSADYYGPGGVGTVAGDSVFGAVLAGQTVRWPGSLDVPHQFNYLPDMARALVTLGERPEADGEVWHLPAAGATTVRAFLERVFAEAGRPPRVAALSPGMLRVIGLVVPFIRESREIAYQFSRPFVADASKFQRVFGPFEPTPPRDAARETLAWFAGRRGT